MTHLSSLTLDHTMIEMIDLMSHLSKSPHKSLKHIDFQGTYIGDAISHIGAVMTSQLICIILRKTDLSERHIEILSEHLPNAPHLQILDLSDNAIGESISVLTQHLKHCKQMKVLRLEETQLEENHIEALIVFLTSWSVDLLELKLSDNVVGNNVTALSSYLQHCQHLQVLDLRCTSLDDNHIESISAVLPQTLQELSLSGNAVGGSLVCLMDSPAALSAAYRVMVRRLSANRCRCGGIRAKLTSLVSPVST